MTFNIKHRMVGYLALLLVWSSIALQAPERLVKSIALVAIYAALDVLWTKIRRNTWYFPLSSLISGLILALVALPNPPWLFVVILPLLAAASKQFLRFGRIRHVFNPAALALGVTSLFIPVVSWWGVSWGRLPLALISIAGLLILWQIRRWHVALAFLATYAIILAALFLIKVPLDALPRFLVPQLLDGTLLFFATVMVVEPMTSNFPRRRDGLIYGALVAVFAHMVSFLGGLLPAADPLILGLLAGNLISFLIFVPRRI